MLYYTRFSFIGQVRCGLFKGEFMKKTQILSLFLAILMLMSFSLVGEALEKDDNVALGSHSLHAAVPLAGSEQLLDTAQAVVAYELNTDTLLYTWNADQRLNPTGMVKLLTALIVLEQGNLDDIVTVYRSTLDTIVWGAVSAGLKAGEEVPLRDLLLCVMVASANDAAAVMAVHIAGSQERFVEMMNEKALQLGCTNSNFTNVHGLFDEAQYSTARDLAVIVEAALENETFFEMFSRDNFSMAATNLSGSRYFITTNYMMSDEYMNQYFDYRVTGGKPAAATSMDRSMICTAEVGNSRYLFVVMSTQSPVSEDGLSVLSFENFIETRKLMNYAFNGYTVRQIADRDQVFYQYAVNNGQNDVVLGVADDVRVLLPAGYDKDAVVYQNVVDAAKLKAPIAQGDVLGYLQISYDGLILAKCDLVAMNFVTEKGSVLEDAERIPIKQEVVDDSWKDLLIWGGVGLACVVLLILVSIKLVQNLRIRRMQGYRMRKRRRSR